MRIVGIIFVIVVLGVVAYLTEGQQPAAPVQAAPNSNQFNFKIN